MAANGHSKHYGPAICQGVGLCHGDRKGEYIAGDMGRRGGEVLGTAAELPRPWVSVVLRGMDDIIMPACMLDCTAVSHNH